MNYYEDINQALILLAILFGYALLNILIKRTKDKKCSEEAEKKKEEMSKKLNEEECRKWRVVALDSIWLRQVKILNNRINYIPLDEKSYHKRIRKTVNSKTKYDRAQFDDLLKCYLKENRSEVLSILSELDKKRGKGYQQGPLQHPFLCSEAGPWANFSILLGREAMNIKHLMKASH